MAYIKHEAGNSEAWICQCKNTPCGGGFYACDPTGKEVEPVEGWCGLYVCFDCGAIIDPDTLEIRGYGTPPCKLEQETVFA